MPSSGITDVIVENIAERLSNIRSLDISYCEEMGAYGLEAIGKHCKKLKFLRRNTFISNTCSSDDEALAIAATMPNLMGLELRYKNISAKGFIKIVEGCKILKTIDITGCRKVEIDYHRFMDCGGRMHDLIIYDDLH